MSGTGKDPDEPGGLPVPDPAEFARQLREAADRLMGMWTGGGGSGRSPASGAMGWPFPLVPPATAWARQLEAVLADLEARRAQVQALQTQLGLFDEQLAALETSLQPMLTWARTWAGLEGTITDLWRPPGRPPASGADPAP